MCPRRVHALILAAVWVASGCSGDAPRPGSISIPEEVAEKAKSRPLVTKKGSRRPATPSGRR